MDGQTKNDMLTDNFDIEALVEAALAQDTEKLRNEMKDGLYQEEKTRRVTILRDSMKKAKELKADVHKTSKPDQKLWDSSTNKATDFFTDSAWNAKKKAEEAYNNFMKLLNDAWTKPSKDGFNKLEQKLKKGGSNNEKSEKED